MPRKQSAKDKVTILEGRIDALPDIVETDQPMQLQVKVSQPVVAPVKAPRPGPGQV